LVFRNELNSIFRSDLQKKEKLSYARRELDRLAEDYRNNFPLFKRAWRTDIPIANNDYFDAMTLYSALKNSNEYKLRIDPYSTITLFSNNREFLLTLGNKLNTTAVKFWEPNVAYIELLKSKLKFKLLTKCQNYH